MNFCLATFRNRKDSSIRRESSTGEASIRVFLYGAEHVAPSLQGIECRKRELPFILAHFGDHADPYRGASAPIVGIIPRLQHPLRHAAAQRNAQQGNRSGGDRFLWNFLVEHPSAIGAETR